MEAGFREIKQEIGRAQTQTRNPDAVTNPLHFGMVASTTVAYPVFDYSTLDVAIFGPF